MLGMNAIRQGTAITLQGEPYLTLKVEHVHLGRGGAIVRVKLRNLISGNVLEQTLKEGDKLEEANLERKKANFLYQEDNNYYFMDNETYEQFFFSEENIGRISNFVKEDSNVEVLYYNDKPVTVYLPPKVELKVTQAPPGVRGDSATNVTKQITLETGYIVDAPLFIKEGDVVKINTETGEYVERAADKK